MNYLSAAMLKFIFQNDSAFLALRQSIQIKIAPFQVGKVGA